MVGAENGWRAMLKLGFVVILLGISGCQQWAWFKPIGSPLTPVMPETATLEEVIAKVNQEASQIYSLKSSNATVGGRAGGWPFPNLTANLAVERPHKFRLVGEIGLIGSREVDLGSNDDLFWFWVRRNQPPAVYFCRHDDFAQSDIRRQFPIEPQWVIDSLGMAMLDPASRHQGPTPVGKGRLEIRTEVPGQSGTYQRVTRIDTYQGRIVEQHLYDQAGTLLASSLIQKYRQDAATGLHVPQNVELHWPPAELVLKLDLGDVEVNRMTTANSELWTLPEVPGFAPTNLAHLRLQPATPAAYVPRGQSPVDGQNPPTRIETINRNFPPR